MSGALIRDLRVAIDREMAATRAGDPIVLVSGRRLSIIGARAVWSFAAEPGGIDLLSLDQPGRLTTEAGSAVDARVLAVGDESVVLSVPADFDPARRCVLVADARFINERLLERLDELQRSGDCDEALLVELVDPDLLDVLTSGDDDGGPSAPASSEDEQVSAAERAVQPGVRFTWGPPGTGKTRVLGMAVARAARSGMRVLVLAHANVAVDVALERVADELGPDDVLVAEGRVVRAGTPQLPSMIARTDLLPHHIASQSDPALAERVDVLAATLSDLSDRARSSTDTSMGAQIDQVRSELRAAQGELQQASAMVVDDAAVVATTLSRTVIDRQIWESDFDVIVVDEASMAPLPIVLALVMRGATTVSFFGDFRQLPPIAVSDDEASRAFFATDVFDFGRVKELHELGEADPRLSVLRTQFRMGDQICGAVNELAYGGLLRTAPAARAAAIAAAESGIGSGEELVLIETSTLGGRCEVEVAVDGWSRINLRHAVVAASVAESLKADGFERVGVISPYRAQIQLISPLVGSVDGVEAATVHRFQGSECDAVVLDLVDADPMKCASLLTGKDVDMALRLVNVAVSRARHKLVVLADLRFVHDALPPGSAPRDLASYITDRVAPIDGAWLLGVLVAADAAATAPGSAGAVWSSGWTSAAGWMDRAIGAGSAIEANVVGPGTLTDWLTTLDVRLDRPSASIVRADVGAAGLLDSTRLDLRLQRRGDTPWVIIDERVVAIGGADGDGPVAVIDDAAFVRAMRNVVTPKGG